MILSKRYTPIMILLIMIGFFLRIHNLTAVPLRGDEAFSVLYWAGLPLNESLTNIATIEPHPALTYVVFRLWGQLFGLTEFAMRMLPALINTLGIPAIYALANRLGYPRTGLIAALLFALNPYEIWHAQDVRNYALWAALSLIALWLGLHAAHKNRPFNWFLYAIAAALAANIFYTELLTLSAFGIFIFIMYRHKQQIQRRWFIAATFAAGLSILSFLLLQTGLFVRGGYAGNVPGIMNVSRILTEFFPTFIFGSTFPQNLTSALWIILGIACLVAVLTLWRHHQYKVLLFIGLLILIPTASLSLISTRINIFDPRYTLSVVPPLIILIASLIDRLTKNRNLFYQIVGATILISWLSMSAHSLFGYYTNPEYRKSEDWPTITRYLHTYTQPDDLVIQSTADAAFGYYFHTTSSIPLDISLPANPSQPNAELTELLQSYRQQYHALWRIGQTFADWPNAGIVENWLATNMQQVLDVQVDRIPIRQYRAWEVEKSEITHQNIVDVSDIAQIVEMQTLLPPSPDGDLTLWLYWKPQKLSPNPLKIYIHLVTIPDTPPLTQDDQFPQQYRVSTIDWDLQTIYRDVYQLPLNGIEAGEYQLYTGFYDPETNQRIPDSSVFLGTISIQ